MSRAKAKSQRRREGDILAIDLGDGWLAFGRVLPNPLIAFYDLRAREAPALTQIVAKPIAFRVWVMKYAITKGLWRVIGHVPLTQDLMKEPGFAKLDAHTGNVSVYYDKAGRERPATSAERMRLEPAAVWDPEHVVERLNDHFAGRPNEWLESMRRRMAGDAT